MIWLLTRRFEMNRDLPSMDGWVLGQVESPSFCRSPTTPSLLTFHWGWCPTRSTPIPNVFLLPCYPVGLQVALLFSTPIILVHEFPRGIQGNLHIAISISVGSMAYITVSYLNETNH